MPFLVCDETRFAQAAVDELIETVAERGRLVVLHGPAGVGKSHLAHLAIREMARRGVLVSYKFAPPDIRVEAAETLPEIPWPNAATKRGDISPRRLLVCEDLQMAARHDSVQQAIVSWLDECRSTGADCVVTMNRTPGDVSGLTTRLRNRLRAGVCAALPMPGAASREKLLQHFCVHTQFPIPASVCQLFARRLAISPRELLGVMRRFDEFTRQRDWPLNAHTAMSFLKTEILPRPVTLEEIARAVSREFGVKLADVRSDARDTTLKTARQCAMYLARELTRGPFAQIGEYFEHRSHSTVMHACHRIEELLADDAALRQRIATIKQSFGNATSAER